MSTPKKTPGQMLYEAILTHVAFGLPDWANISAERKQKWESAAASFVFELDKGWFAFRIRFVPPAWWPGGRQ